MRFGTPLVIFTPVAREQDKNMSCDPLPEKIGRPTVNINVDPGLRSPGIPCHVNGQLVPSAESNKTDR